MWSSCLILNGFLYTEKDGTSLCQFSVTVSDNKVNTKLFILRQNVQNELQCKFINVSNLYI